MRACLLCLLAALFPFVPAAAQAPNPQAEGQSHIQSAFTSTVDARVLSAGVALGPALRQQLGGTPEGREVYRRLLERIGSNPVRVRVLRPGEAVAYASLPGISLSDPLYRLEAGETVLLMQYATTTKNVNFIEQLSGPAAVQASPPVEAPKPAAAQVELPKPPLAPAAPAIVAVPLAPTPPAPVAAPAAPAVAAAKPAAPAAAPAPAAVAAPALPRGECVIKPVMSEDDLRNCAAPGRSVPPPAAEPVAAAAAQPSPPPALRTPECVVKPVMSEEDLRICAASRGVSQQKVAPVAEPVVAAAPEASAAVVPKTRTDCVIKPVMSEEDLRICAASRGVSQQRVAPVAEPAVAAAAPKEAAPPAKARAECVIKPVMSEEDLRICAAVRGGTPPPVAQPVSTAAPSSAPPPARAAECVIKPVMSEADLRACGVRR